MSDVLTAPWSGLLAASVLATVLKNLLPYLLIFFGFSAIIFFHELGHFLAAKWAGVRVSRFAVGFGRELFGFTRGETRYSFNVLPLGGYVKMLGQDDFSVDPSGEIKVKDDPRAFPNKPVGHRLLIVSGGVVMNVVLAAFLFMAVFMLGTRVGVTEIGHVVPDQPADLAGLQVGDIVRRIDGESINEFQEIMMAVRLAAPHRPMEFEVERDGQLKRLMVQPINNPANSVLAVGIAPAVTNTLVGIGPDLVGDRPDRPRLLDKVVEIGGQEINDDNANDMLVFMMLQSQSGQDVEVVVERPAPNDPTAPPERVQVKIPTAMQVTPSEVGALDSINILGLTPLVRITTVEPGSRAELADLRPGDLVQTFGGIDYPTISDVNRLVRENPERDIPVVVQRMNEAGQAETKYLVATPKLTRRVFRSVGPPRIGAGLAGFDGVLRVGTPTKTLAGGPSPAAIAGIPAGALIKTIDDTPVTAWHEVVERFRQAAGHSVVLGYVRDDGTEATCDFPVPRCPRTELGLAPMSRILAINNEEYVTARLRGQVHSISVKHPFGLREALKRHVGETVTVRYRETPLSEPQEAQVHVDADMVDPWLGRIAYVVNVNLAQQTKVLRTSNPIKAMSLGIKKTTYFVLQVYTIMQRMIFTRSVGVQNISGPVGIVRIGSRFADAGMVELLSFFAIISANLAVFNLLPLPILDGGHIVFLFIEKIKGTPVSIKIQMVTQAIGLFLIITAFVLVTFQDIVNWTG